MHNGHRVDTRCSTLKTTCIMSLRGNDIASIDRKKELSLWQDLDTITPSLDVCVHILDVLSLSNQDNTIGQ